MRAATDQLMFSRLAATKAALLLLFVLILACSVWAQLAPPALTAHVIDTTGTLREEQRQQLDARLTQFEHERGTQIVVLVVPTTQPEDIASYANRVANVWKIGRRDVGDGLLLVLAKNDRKVRIEVAKSLEGAIPDLAAKRIINESITPRFKTGDFAGGLSAGAEQLMTLIAGEALPKPDSEMAPASAGSEEFEWMDLSIFLFFAVPLVSAVAGKIMGSTFGTLFTGAAVGGLVMAITANPVMAVIGAFLSTLFSVFINLPGSGKGGRSAGGWSSSSGSDWGSSSSGSDSSSFSSGGGGDFGGGGASGDW